MGHVDLVRRLKWQFNVVTEGERQISLVVDLPAGEIFSGSYIWS
jgi:hypothetical protein